MRLRDQYGERTLPAPYPALAVELSEVLLAAYASAPFVRQLELIAMRDQHVQLAVRDYHRAYAQRSRWLEQGVLAPAELREWEDRLFEEWEHAWQRMLDTLPDPADEPAQATAGKQLYGDMEQSSLNPLRDGRDRFLHVGTINGMADVTRVGWHPDSKARPWRASRHAHARVRCLRQAQAHGCRDRTRPDLRRLRALRRARAPALS